MINETDKGILIKSIKDNIPFEYTVGANTYTFDTQVSRFLEDVEREDYAVVIEFRPTGRKYGKGLNSFVGWRDDTEEYADFGYGDEELITIMVLARTHPSVHGRYIAYAWCDLIERFIRFRWESLINGWVQRHSFTTITEVPNFFAGKQYIYQFSFTITSHHGWSNEPGEDPREVPDVEAIEVEGATLRVESE